MSASSPGLRFVLSALAVVCLAGVAAPEAAAVTYGHPDCDEGECKYPNTVSLSGFRAPGEGEGASLVSFLRCSGSLLDKSSKDRFVILTAGHCASAYLAGLQDGTLKDVGVSFDPKIVRDVDEEGALWSPAQYVLGGRPVLPEEYGPQGANASNIQFDYAVIVFKRPKGGIVRTSAGTVVDLAKIPEVELPDEGFLDRIVSATTPLPLTAVGYGTGEAHNKPGEGGNAGGAVNDLSKLGVRWVTDFTSAFSFMGPEANLLLGSQNPARGDEGTCGGDSGGPLFLQDEPGYFQVGITSSGDAICRATSIIARTDSTRAVQFLSCVLEPGAKVAQVLTCGCTSVDSQGECPGSD
jgi:Trypsin